VGSDQATLASFRSGVGGARVGNWSESAYEGRELWWVPVRQNLCCSRVCGPASLKNSTFTIPTLPGATGRRDTTTSYAGSNGAVTRITTSWAPSWNNRAPAVNPRESRRNSIGDQRTGHQH